MHTLNLKILNSLDIKNAEEIESIFSDLGELINIIPERKMVLSKIHLADAYMASAAVEVDKEFLSHAKKLKIIGSPSTGVDHLDVKLIKSKNIKLFDISKEYDLLKRFTATSELAFGLILALNRKIIQSNEQAKMGNWAREYFKGFQLFEKTMGVIGLGRLGAITTRIAKGFGMKVIAYDPYVSSSENVNLVTLDELLKTSDVISIHVHLSSETINLINTNEFKKMKSNCILINTSRGKIVNEKALLNALEKKYILGAGLDVIDGEWLDRNMLKNHPLVTYSRKNSNLLIVPHIGGSTDESIKMSRIFMADKVANYIRKNTNLFVNQT